MYQNDTFVGAMLLEPEYEMVTDSTFAGLGIHLKSQKRPILLTGNIEKDLNLMTGEICFGDKTYELELRRGEKPLYRPQTPKIPYPYISKDIIFRNETDSINLGGTLTLPDSSGNFPAVILIGGSMPGNRNGEGNHHQSFLVIADFLTRNGIAVLRYDSRGIGISEGNFFKSTAENTAKDVNAAFQFLAECKEINTGKIGVIGFSEGGLVAAIAASQNNEISFVVMMAGLAIDYSENTKLQMELKLKHGDISIEQYDFFFKTEKIIQPLLLQNVDKQIIIDSIKVIQDDFIKTIKKTEQPNIIENFALQFSNSMRLSKHYRFLYACNPFEYISKISCPVFSLNGTLDLNVPAKENQYAIRTALIKGGNENFKIIELEGINHSFQECKTGTVKEAKELEQTISPKALAEILHWMKTLEITN
jgi:dipeptidyl aminopeptidase/acylaminoacyl peptidase